MTIKLKDLARIANVSEATVSLALNDSHLVKEETKIRVKNIAKEQCYTPNAIARGLAKKKSGTIGLVVPDIESAYYGKLVSCINEYLKQAGYGLVLAISNDKPEIEKKIIRNFVSGRVEGIIIVPVNEQNRDLEYIEDLTKNDIPCIFVSSFYQGLKVPYVMVDLEDGMYKLVKYLLDLGHKNIIFLVGSSKVITTLLRLLGYKKAFKERNLEIDENCFIECKRLDYDNACEVAERLIKSGKSVDAIVTINDMMALGVVNTLKKMGSSIPEKISVAGYDNMIFSSISYIPITTVSQDVDKMSRAAVDMIISGIKGPGEAIENVLIKPELIIRDSTSAKR